MTDTETTPVGHLHPITIMIDHISRIMTEIGFDIADGPELEKEFYNFDALNVPKDHPSRDMQDTFWLKQKEGDGERLLLRTHTSPVQIRTMEQWAKAGCPNDTLAIIAPGKTFRNEATDATHEAQFHQIEGFLIGKDVSLAHLRGVLEHLFTGIFGKAIQVRLRTSFFPFTEPSAEIDMQCFKCEGKGLKPAFEDGSPLNSQSESGEQKTVLADQLGVGLGCGVCKQTGWIEIMGSGMVHPNVLENCGVDSRVYQGFAFGGGVDRLAMLKWGIDDVRLLYSGDLRVVNQF
jgi:phenylalanyl-tRNA synthetase alpha chain